MEKIFYGKAVYDHNEINAVIRVLKKNSLNLIDGPHVKKLEKSVKHIRQKIWAYGQFWIICKSFKFGSVWF